MPEITIGVLNYNGLQYLQRTIPALLKQDHPSYEVIVVDNASSDGSQEYLQDFDDQLRLITNEENLGYCRGKNQLVESAKGEYVLLLDEDLLIPQPQALKKLQRVYEKNPTAFLTVLLKNEGETETPYVGGFWGWFAYGTRPRWPVKLIESFAQKHQQTIKTHVPEGQAVFFKRDLFLEIGGYDDWQPYYLDVGDLGLRSNVLTHRENYCHLGMCFVHLGIKRRDDVKRWAWNLQYMFPGAMRMLLKNFTWPNVIRFTPTIFAFYFGGSLLQAIKRHSFLVLKSFWWSVGFFLKSLPDTLRQRREIQTKRVIPGDDFLKIKRPNFSHAAQS